MRLWRWLTTPLPEPWYAIITVVQIGVLFAALIWVVSTLANAN